MASNLLLYWFIIFNGPTIAVTSAITWSGCLLPVLEHNQSRSTLINMTLLLASLLWSWRNRSSTRGRARTRRKYSSIEGGQHAIRARSARRNARSNCRGGALPKSDRTSRAWCRSPLADLEADLAASTITIPA